MTYLQKLQSLPAIELQAHLRSVVNLNPSCPFSSAAGETVIVNGLVQMKGIGKTNAQRLYNKAQSV